MPEQFVSDTQSSFESFAAWLLGLLFASAHAVTGILAAVRKVDAAKAEKEKDLVAEAPSKAPSAMGAGEVQWKLIHDAMHSLYLAAVILLVMRGIVEIIGNERTLKDLLVGRRRMVYFVL